MPSLFADEPISPELVLVASPEEAEQARQALPDYEHEFHAWVEHVRSLTSATLAHDEAPDRGRLVFGAVVCLNAIAPIVLYLVFR